ncbi:MAG TPA: flagellar hook capping FlgD N-terminal domain-containing protein [Candidatus Limnocylindria bacterium]|nr:flagellar hook capping FlgD N-terminal domain-containing protein [Candidatus Limnocylindria bacterium]
MATSSISSVSSSADLTDTTSRVPLQVLGQDDFLKLLVAQLSAQDPLNPQKDTEFIAQMAQFSALEQAKSMEVNISALRTQQTFVQANALLGREVSLQIDKDTTVQGVVSAVNIEAGTPKIVVNDQAYDMAGLLSVSLVQPQSATQTSQP